MSGRGESWLEKWNWQNQILEWCDLLKFKLIPLTWIEAEIEEAFL